MRIILYGTTVLGISSKWKTPRKDIPDIGIKYNDSMRDIKMNPRKLSIGEFIDGSEDWKENTPINKWDSTLGYNKEHHQFIWHLRDAVNVDFDLPYEVCTIVSEEVIRLDSLTSFNKLNMLIKYGMAFCSKKDQFSRRIGRNVAMDRIKSNDVSYSGSIHVPTMKSHSRDFIFFAIATDVLIHKPKIPKFAKTLIREQLDEALYHIKF